MNSSFLSGQKLPLANHSPLCSFSVHQKSSSLSAGLHMRNSEHLRCQGRSTDTTCLHRLRRQHSIIAHAAAQESQDVDDLEAEIEEEMENAYEEGVNVDVVPGAQAAKLASQRMRRQENTDSRSRRKSEEDAFDQRILQISRVTKVVKGGKQISFRAVVAVGDGRGSVGVGTASAKEIAMGVRKAVIDAQNNMISIPLTRGFSFPHKQNGIAGGAKVMLRPASEGTGVIAGGAVREVLELAGVKNGFGKQLGSDNPLNNARATIDGFSKMRTLKMAAKNRDLTVEQMLGAQ